MNTSLDIKKIYDLIDLYKYASVDGERVEIIVTPYEENGKWDNSKRVLTIGLQGGFSRDRDSIVIENAEEFDKKVLPLLVSYYEQDDALGKWDITIPEVENVTNKGVSETESGNLFYLESFDKDIYDKVTEAKENVQVNTTYKKVKLNDREKVWDEIILYAKSRRMTQDFYNGESYTDEEKKAVYNFVVNLSNEKRVNTTFIRKSLENTQKFIEEIFKDRDKLKSLGLTDELIDKLNNSVELSKLAKLASAEKRIRRRVDVNNPSIAERIKFATTELERVGYFDLRNASLAQFENGVFKSSKPLALQKLKENYENNSEYEHFCDEILSYLNTKAMANNRVVETKVEEPEIIVNNELNNNYIVDSYEKFYETLDLVRYGKLDDERYEIIVEPDRLDSNARIVRISLLDGVSRNDSFMFKFTDGALFDNEFKKTLENIREEDPNFLSTINAVNVPTLGLVKHALHESRDRNEILIKQASDALAYPHSTKVVPDSKNEENKQEIPLDEDLLKKLARLEEQINGEARKQDEIMLDATVSFDKLHEYVKTYKIDNSKGELKLYRRDTGEEYIPSSEAEKNNIEFAIYWGVSAGIEEDKEDVVVGEKYAFNEENKKLFDLLDVQFRESVKRGIPVDIESLKKQFENSGVKGSDAIFNRLFRNNYYVDYVTKYYEKSIGKQLNQENLTTTLEPVVEEALFDEEKMKSVISKLYDLCRNEQLPFSEKEKMAKELDNEVSEFTALRDELEKKSQTNPEKYYKEYLKFVSLYTELLAAKEELDTKLQEKEEVHNVDLSIEDRELCEYFRLDILRGKGKLPPKGYSRIEELKSNEKVLGLEIANNNVLEALKKLDAVQDKNSDLYKLLERELRDKEEALQKLHDIYRRELSEAIKQNEHDELIEGANEEARRIVAKKEYDEIVKSSKVEARRIVEKEEHDELVEGAQEEARRIVEEAEHDEIVESAQEEAKRIVEKEEHDMILQGAEEEAAKLLQSGKEESSTLNKTEEEQDDLKKGAEEQAKLLTQLKDTLFEVVEQKKEKEKVPEIVEIEDAVEVVETYATPDQPTTIKLFFDRNTPDVADLIISNGTNENETVMYQRTFDKDKIVNEIIPVVCDLYARDNTPYYNKTFDVPNTNRGGLIVLGTNEKTFQISNAEKEIVALCEKLINENLAKNKQEEEQKTK